MTNRTAIDTVIFDIGNVLADFQWAALAHRLFGEMDGQRFEALREAMWGNNRWAEFDRGVMTDDEVIDSFVRAKPELEREIRIFCDVKTIGGCVSRFDYAIPWVKSVKATGRRVLYLSNYSYLMLKANPGKLDFLPFMDGGVFSCCVKLIKPDQAIYARICENYNLSPSGCVFIDDNANNIQAARDFGMKGIRFESYEQAHAELDVMLAS